MPTIFLSHTSVDKPFVEKLARDLTRYGCRVWYDKWAINVGDSLFWKIEEGIRENEYLAIILSPESLKADWVKKELGAAFAKQIKVKKITILPVLLRDCDIPLLLADTKYADFRINYDTGLSELANVLGVKEKDTVSIDNWRKHKRTKNSFWETHKSEEFRTVVSRSIDLAREYNWSLYVGGKNSFCFNISCKSNTVSIKLKGNNNAYYASNKTEGNPNRLASGDFNLYVGNTINECIEFVWRIMEDHQLKYGMPSEKADVYDFIFLNEQEKNTAISKFIDNMRYYRAGN